MNSKTAILGLSILAAISIAPDAKAQGSINTKARSKAVWYNAPHEVQIIDERPMVRDFREAPSAPSSIQLPPAPQGFGGAGGGGGGGAMGDGGAPVLPAGGMPIGGDGGPGYRTPAGSSVPLDKVGFTRNPSNIPAGGIRPRGVLPSGQTTGVHGSLMTPVAHTAAPASGAGNRAAMAPRAATPVASYGGQPYTSAPAGAASGGGGASTAVRGVLLNRLKGN